ncbi:MAG: hypothetical protein ACLFRD_08435 [Nitriliruptoraceae bacterium]
MGRTHICDRRGCPAPAQHHVEVYGQDFHFCAHHWAELEPVLMSHLDPWPSGPGTAGSHRQPQPASSTHSSAG